MFVCFDRLKLRGLAKYFLEEFAQKKFGDKTNELK